MDKDRSLTLTDEVVYCLNLKHEKLRDLQCESI